MVECLMRDSNGKCLIAKPYSEVKDNENIGWDEDGNCKFKDKGLIRYQKCDYYSEDPYSKILCNRTRTR